MSRHALTRESPVRFLTVAAALMVLTAAATPAEATGHATKTATPAEATDHNARVAEYLLFLQLREAGARNACVAEYLLLHHRDAALRDPLGR